MFFICAIGEPRNMATANNDDYKKEALTALSIAPADSAVVTITDIREVSIRDDERESGWRDATIVEMAEYPKHIYWMKPAGRSIVRLQLGSNIARWIGKRLPLVVEAVPNPRTQDVVDVLNVAKLRDWESLLRQSRPGRPAAARAATKRGAKKE